MKFFIYILILFSMVLVGYNLTHINYNAPFEGDSMIAVITVLAGLCAILLLIIVLQSRKLSKFLK